MAETTDKTRVLSTTMHKALILADRFGGKLTRHPGGFWTGPTRHDPERPGTLLPWVGTPTVCALVDRGRMRWAAWAEGRAHRFPIEAERLP